jgi:hypothetical protein
MITEIILNSAACFDPASPEFSLPPVSIQWFKVKEVIIPSLQNSSVDRGNNSVVFYEDTGVKRVATIPSGSYNHATFPPALASAMEQVGDQAYHVTFDNVTKRLTVASDAAFKIASGTSGTTAYKLLGSDQHDTPNKQLSITMPYQIDLSDTNVFLLCSRALSSKYSTYIGGSSGGTNVISMIPNTQSGSIIHYIPDSEWMFLGYQLNTIDLELLDAETHRPLTSFRGPIYVRLAIADEVSDVRA